MNLLNILSFPWVIIPDNLMQICDILNVHLHGPKLNLKDLEIKILESSASAVTPEVKNNVAIIPIVGPIMKNPDIFDRVFYGAVSSARIKADFLLLIADASITKIIFYIDSPGGTVDGTQELAQAIYENRGKKDILAYSDGVIASGAYWIASAADAIFISSDTVDIGSIGVIATHIDYSKNDEMFGIKVTEIFAGKYKAIGSPNKPLSDEGKAYLQDRVDYIYSIFVSDVARNRGVSIETVLSKMADAKIFIGQQAIEAGLVDGVSTLSDLIEGSKGIIAGVAKTEKLKLTEADMEITAEILKKDFSAVYNEIFEAGKASGLIDLSVKIKEEYDKGMSEGQKAEKARIQAIKALLIPGHEALIEEMILDSKITPDQAATKIIQAENAKRQGHLDALKGDKKDVHVDPTSKLSTASAIDPNAPVEDRAKAEWDKSVEIREEFGTFDVFLAYKKNFEAGNIKIIKGGDKS